MAFVNPSYESDLGFTCLYRCSTEEAAAVTAAGGAADASFHALSSGSRRRFGLHPRGVSLSRVVGTAPNTFTKSSFVVIPTSAEYAGLSTGDDFAVGGTTWTISRKVAEMPV